MASLGELRQVEEKRNSLEGRRRIELFLTLLPLAAALSMMAMYITLPAAIASDDPYYQAARPDLASFMRIAPAAITAGALTVAAAAYAVSEVTGGNRGFLRLTGIGILFGLVTPFITGVLMPLNRAFIDAESVAGVRELSDTVVEVVYGTPMFALIYGVTGISEGLAAGAALTGFGWVVFAVTPGSGGWLGHLTRPYILGTAVAILLVLLVSSGPFGLFEFLVELFATR